jgi:16S rRNA (uracil1498-N3)-methyltransferase
MHHLFFATPLGDGTVILDGGESHHACSVLRAQPGDTLTATDGKGVIYTCAVETISSRACTARIVETQAMPRPKIAIHMHIGLPQREAFEAAIQALAPLAVSYITPVVCAHCQIQWWKNKWKKHNARFQRLAIASLKQSLSAYLPIIREPAAFENAVSHAEGVLVYGDSSGNKLDALAPTLANAQSISCFVGPPGGFSNEEIQALKAKQARALRLSSLRLRTELAAAVMAAVVWQAQRV